MFIPWEAPVAKAPLHPRDLGYYFALAQVGLEMVAPIGIGIVLDYYLSWTPWATVGGAVLGLVGGIAHLIAISNRPDAQDETKQRQEDH